MNNQLLKLLINFQGIYEATMPNIHSIHIL